MIHLRGRSWRVEIHSSPTRPCNCFRFVLEIQPNAEIDLWNTKECTDIVNCLVCKIVAWFRWKVKFWFYLYKPSSRLTDRICHLERLAQHNLSFLLNVALCQIIRSILDKILESIIIRPNYSLRKCFSPNNKLKNFNIIFFFFLSFHFINENRWDLHI